MLQRWDVREWGKARDQKEEEEEQRYHHHTFSCFQIYFSWYESDQRTVERVLCTQIGALYAHKNTILKFMITYDMEWLWFHHRNELNRLVCVICTILSNATNVYIQSLRLLLVWSQYLNRFRVYWHCTKSSKIYVSHLTLYFFSLKWFFILLRGLSSYQK